MDAFFASIEQRDNPSLKGHPVIVGADPREGRGRGVVAACSYEARKFGVHSALPISRAWRLCPNAAYLRPSMGKYRENSRRILAIFHDFSPLVEQLSIDEAFLDISARVDNFEDAIRTAYQLKRKIFQKEKLTASVGVAPNKFLAKIASDIRKPDGVYAVRPDNIDTFLEALPIGRLWGVGPKTETRLRKLGIERVGQLNTEQGQKILRQMGKLGAHLAQLCRGIDNRPVVTYRRPKSIGHEHTFSQDTADKGALLETLRLMEMKVADRLRRKKMKGKTVCVKIRYDDFTTITRQARSQVPIGSADEINRISEKLFLIHWDSSRKIRLIGVSVSSLAEESHGVLLPLFSDPDPGDLVF